MTPPQVAMVVPHFPPGYGGAGQQAARLLRALVAAGCGVRVLALAPPDREAPRVEEGRGYSVRRFRAPGRGRLSWMAFGAWVARRLVRDRDWEVLHFHGFGPHALPVVLAVAGRPVLVKTTLLGGDDPATIARGVLGPLLIRAYRRVSAIVALSADLERAFLDDGRFRGAIVRIPNGVDTAVFRPAGDAERGACRAALGLPAGARVVLTAGALVRRKRVDLLIRAVGDMDLSPVVVIHAGPSNFDPAHDRELLHAAASARPGLQVRFLGPVPAWRLATLMRAADLFVLPSAAEGLPNTVLEALASGLPCVAFDIPGCRDVLGDGCGVLVAEGSQESLSREMAALLASPERRARMTQEGLRLVAERYDLERVAERYRELYERLRAEAPASPAR